MLNEYGFKPCVIVNMLYEDYDRERQRLVINSDTYGKVNLKINDRIVDMFERYIELQEYKSRKYMFTYPNGKQLKTNNIMETLAEKLRNENLKEASACRISLKGVEKLIKTGAFVNEIQIISGYTQNKISRVYDYMNRNSDISEAINMKLNKKPDK